ncbi:glycosyltransferase family 9 protein [Salegentibacter sp. F188]|uniref:Glycosyltransferase family 9 protein n=1 Tax=Autumnicola patrickiae TaxID=3075591 RepID=A0ABU3DXN1_9FLAO|nr:glycosyltransferase family 9 protein [Salegentibacter sp. F188]MDT0688470.1 glycosyltransferase family 9 protein [Salegentibacter sp. F188]
MKILVIQQKMIGDVLTSSILFEALRKEYPKAKLHYLIHPHTTPVVENNPFIDKIITYDPQLNRNPLGFLRFSSRIRENNYTAVIDVYSKISTGMISRFSGAVIRLSFEKKYTSVLYSRTFRYLTTPKTAAGLAVENRMQLLQGLNKNFPQELKPKIYLSESEKQAAREKLRKANMDMEKPLVMCGVLGSSPSKSYPLKFMATVLNELADTLNNVQILFNYLPSQRKEAEKIYNYCSEETRSRIFLNIYEKELKGFILNCANCDLFIGNEGGAANIAKALEIPTFSIYSPSVKKSYWAIYEDGLQNKSIHLEDYPIEERNPKNNKGLKPEYFLHELRDFVTEIFLNNSKIKK